MSPPPFTHNNGSDGSEFVYVFVDDSHPITVNNLRVGSLCSPVLGRYFVHDIGQLSRHPLL